MKPFVIVNTEDATFDSLVKELKKDPHALDGIVVAHRFLNGLPESQRRTAKEQVDRLLTVWNQTGPDARKCFLLLEPTSGRTLTKEQRSKSAGHRGGVSSGRKRSEKWTTERAKVQQFVDVEVRKLHAIGEPFERKTVLQMVRVNPKTKDTPLEDATIMKMIRKRPKRP